MAKSQKFKPKTGPVKQNAGSPSRPKRASRDVSAFPVVGIGASAGGLSALTHLLKQLPAETGVAIVVIQHLDPKHESLTAEILSRTSLMPVSEVRDRTRIERNHVYVIPPNRNLRLSKEVLALSPRIASAQHLPVDFFFQSLAADKKNLAIGVVLSGIASDGTEGLRAIKSEGGLTFAQDPKTAQYNGMPRSAISSGAVDIIETPEGIAEEILRISRLFTTNISIVPGEIWKSGPEGSLRRILLTLRNVTGIDFTQYKQNTIQRRVSRRQLVLKIPTLDSYARYLAEHREEVKMLFEDLLIRVTGFFRDPQAFEWLKSHVLPKYMKDWDKNAPFRVWVPGCSTGEEVYSIAMIFLEFLDRSKVRPQLQIFASDISEKAIRKARAGVYPESIANDVSKTRLRHFFEETEGGYRIGKWIRDTCLFSKQDITSDPPFAKIDLISCRNVLIYFAPELQKRVLPMFHYALNPGGILWLGRSETISGFANLFTIENKSNRFYLKNNIATPFRLEFPIARQPADSIAARGKMPAFSLQEVQHEADRVAMHEYVPPGIVINNAHDILQVRGRPAPYLELTPGQATLNLFKLARPEIVAELRSLINIARQENRPSKSDALTLRDNGLSRQFGIKVVPLRVPAQSLERCFSIFFEEAVRTHSEIQASQDRWKPKTKAKNTSGRREIRPQHTEEQKYQQALIEEYETTQEDLTSANEELQSTNEELQSTNEELETAKEELQSANEEMTTVNDELQTRNSEMTTITNDLTNLLASVDIPIVMVGHDGKVRRFTPKAGQILRLISSDVGRPIGDIRPGIEPVDLDELVSSVTKSMCLQEVEVQDKKGSWYRVQVRPYRTTDNKIDGAVIALMDITALKLAAQKISNARDDALTIIEAMPNPGLVITSDRRVQTANQSFYATFQLKQSETEGRFLSELSAGQWSIPELLKMVEAVLNKGTQFKDFEIQADFPAIGHRHLVINARRADLTGVELQAALIAIEDATERKELSHKLELAEARHRIFLENAYNGILVISQKGLIEFANRRAEIQFGYSPGELRGQSYEILIPDQVGRRLRRQCAEFLRHPEDKQIGGDLEVSCKRKDGSLLPVEISLSPLTVDSDVLITAFILDISERKKQQLETERVNRMRDEFLGVLSHELRTPLTNILAWSQLLLLGTADKEKTLKGVAAIEKSANEQRQLIDDLLDVARIQAGKMYLAFSDLDPGDCVSGAVDSVRTLADKRSLTIETKLEPSCRITADLGRLQQAFRNLLTNAIKFTPPGGKISVQLKRIKDASRESVQIEVRDTGRGIKAEFLPRLFTRFAQADGSATRGHGGLGLGLSIVRHLVEMHGGTVTAESPGEGKGATFKVHLPCTQNAQPKVTPLKPDSVQAVSENLAGLRVLLVDDMEDTRDGLATVLQSLGAEVQTSASAREGFKALADFKPHVLLCDIAMPDEDGYRLIRRIRALGPRQGGKIPAVALTAYAGAEHVRRAAEAKFDAHLAKPVDMASLCHVIAKLVKQ